jgi:hypothetical protein
MAYVFNIILGQFMEFRLAIIALIVVICTTKNVTSAIESSALQTSI